MVKKNGDVLEAVNRIEGLVDLKLEAKKGLEKKHTISIPSLNIISLKLKIVGDSDLIVHQFSAPALHGIECKQQGKATAGRVKRDPETEVQACFYRGPKGEFQFKAQSFKLAATDCCSSLGKTIPKTLVRQSHHVIGAMVDLHGEWYSRTDVTRPQPGVCTPTYRPAFKAGWWCILHITLNQNAMSIEQLVTLYNHAGFSVGVGDWRPTRSGSFGMFHVEEVLS